MSLQHVPEAREERSLNWLREQVCGHRLCRTVNDFDEASCKEVRQPKESDVDVSRLFCSWAPSLNHFDCRLIILIDKNRGGGKALGCEERL